MTQANPIVSAQGVCRSYGEVEALRGVDLEVHSGEIVGFVGPNGAGKTTFLRCLVGLTRRDEGTVTMAGLDPDQKGVAVRRQTTYLPGETSVYRGMTGAMFLSFALRHYERRPEDSMQELLEGFDLPVDRKVLTYSAGMKQKLALVATLGAEVPIYLLDEPDRALDPTARQFLRETLLQLRAEGKAILFSSHHLDEVKQVADRIVFLSEGLNIPQQTIDEATAVLRRRVRVRMTKPTDFPPGALELQRDPDGTALFEADDPIEWAQSLPSTLVDTLEVGMTRLDDVYKLVARPRNRSNSGETSS